MRDRRGFTLVEAVVALALVATVGVSVSTALVASRAMAVHDRDQAIGRVAAQARLATLTSLAFHTIAGADGSAVAVTDTTTDVSAEPPGPGGTGLGESPADALWRDRPGYVDYLDATGRDLGRRAGAREQAAYVRRWVIARQGGGAGEVAVIAVLVAPVSTAARAAAGDADAPDRLARRRRAARRAGAPGVMRGASLIELLIAVALALVISAAGVRALVEAADAFAWQPASAELSARADAVAQLLTADLGGRGRRAVRPPRDGRGAGRRAGVDPAVVVAAADPAARRGPGRRRRRRRRGHRSPVDPHRGRRRAAGGGAPAAAALGLPAGADVPGARRWLRRPRPHAAAVARGTARIPAGRSRRRGRLGPGRARRDAGGGRRASSPASRSSATVSTRRAAS